MSTRLAIKSFRLARTAFATARPVSILPKHVSLPFQVRDMSKVGAAQPFLDAMLTRRSIYKLSKEAVIPDDRVVEIVNHAVKHVPCSL